LKIKSLKVKNFRGYKGETIVGFDNLTAFVGKNDVGKSSILEALDIFFNEGKGVVKIDKTDVNIFAAREDDQETIISVVFSELPDEIIIDSSVETSLAREYKKLQELIFRNEEKLQATMTYEQKDLFEKYTECVHEFQTTTDCLIF